MRVPALRRLVCGLAPLWLVLTGCRSGSVEPSRVLLTPPALAERPAAPRADIHDYDSALRAIVHSLESDLGLPRVDVALVLFDNRRSFEAGLVDLGYPPELARRSASTFQAIGGARAVLVNRDLLTRQGWNDRVRLLAHELTHSVQYRLAGGKRGTSEQWLREGAAEWIACRVSERLGYASFASLRHSMLAPLAGLPSETRPAPLRELRTFPQWAAAHERYHVPLYSQAFAAAELLIEQHGLATVVDYFARFAGADDADANFAHSFRVSLDEFEEVFQRRWQRLTASIFGPAPSR
jgi:hypothetical protein